MAELLVGWAVITPKNVQFNLKKNLNGLTFFPVKFRRYLTTTDRRR